MNNNIFYMSGSHYGDVKKKNHNQYMMCLNLKEAVYFQTAAILILDFEHKKTFHSVKTDDIFTFIIKFRR